MLDVLALIGRTDDLFNNDIYNHEENLLNLVGNHKFLVLGGAGSIGQAVVKEIFKRQPKKLHVVDISENNMVELVRDIRSSFGYINGDFQTFALDIGSLEYDAFIAADGDYDYVLNLSALKHVRSEKDPFTLMRMIDVNVLNTQKTLQQSISSGVKKYFCVSTDKAANPVNMMGASKRIMEMFLMGHSHEQLLSMARFANVAFSDGSLLHGFNQRLQKRQPIVAPNDIRRYFVTPQESGELCLMSCLLGENRDIFFPKLSESLHLITFAEIAERYLRANGFTAYLCQDEDEARALASSLPEKGLWPCLFTGSDTTGEKGFEEFFTAYETVDMTRFQNLGIVKNSGEYDADKLAHFIDRINAMKQEKSWTKPQLVELFHEMIPDFGHKETGKYLDSKM
jgi:Predicted nucleoside-diphosphate sugar epimerases